MVKQKGICEVPECGKEYEYEYNPKYPRKYCPECSAAKKQAYEDNAVPVVKPGAHEAPLHPQGITESPKQNNILHIKNPYEKDPVGLAVEVFLKLYEGGSDDYGSLMKAAANLVKQAREAFE